MQGELTYAGVVACASVPRHACHVAWVTECHDGNDWKMLVSILIFEQSRPFDYNSPFFSKAEPRSGVTLNKVSLVPQTTSIATWPPCEYPIKAILLSGQAAV